MNKLFYLLIALGLLVSSCGNNVEFNDPAFQGEIDGIFWKADQYTLGSNQDGHIIITGIGNGQQVSIKFPDPSVGTYQISGGINVAAEYIITTSGLTDVYSTLVVGEGTIKVTEASSNGFSGEFNFRAFKGDQEISVAFGSFYRIKSNVANPELVSLTCDYATDIAQIRRTNYLATPDTSENFFTVCEAYKEALLFQKQVCGDESGAIQAQINALGDCLGANGNGTLMVTVNGELKEFDIAYVDVVGNEARVTGNITGSSDSIYFHTDLSLDLNDPMVSGFDTVRNFIMNIDGVQYEDTDPGFPYDPDNPTTHPNNFSGNLLNNTGNAVAGTLNGMIYDISGGSVTLSNGVFNLSY